MDCAIKANRIFEAFMIAYSHPTESQHYMNYVVEKYSLTESDDFLSTFLKPLSQQNYNQIIDSYDLGEWKDILTFIVNNIENTKDQDKYIDQLIKRF